MPRLAKWIGDFMETVMDSKMPKFEVVNIISISTNLKKLTFRGDLTGGDFQPGCAVIIRVNDTDYRNYTPCNVDVQKGIFDILFYLHGNAPGTNFVEKLRLGDEIRISSPRGHRYYDPSVKKFVMFGDETSLGLAISLQQLMKMNKKDYQFYFELDTANLNLPELLSLEHATILHKRNKVDITHWLDQFPKNHDSGWIAANFILTGNVTSIQILRKHLKNEGITGKLSTQGYWLEGKRGL